jgi:hypothetical protein
MATFSIEEKSGDEDKLKAISFLRRLPDVQRVSEAITTGPRKPFEFGLFDNLRDGQMPIRG